MRNSMRVRTRAGRVLSLLLSLMLVIPTVVLPTTPAAARIPYDDTRWPGYPGYDIVLGGVWSRQAVADNMWRFDDRGFNANFAWYSDPKVIQSGSWDNRVWSSRARDNAYSWYSQGFWWTPLKTLFYRSPATFHAWEFYGSFISMCCGNFSWAVVNPNPPKISGYKREDTNGDGVLQPGEPGRPGWRVNFYREGVYQGYAVTDANGYYEFSIDAVLGRLPGTWTMAEELQPGWIQTKAPSAVGVLEGSYSASRNYGDNNFGNYKYGSISGLKWNDLDADGSRDTSEPVLAHWPIQLLKNGAIVATAETGADGSYRFQNLLAGTYVVREFSPDGWQQTFPPPPGTHTIPITSGARCLT